MLHVCVQKFDVTGNFEIFWELNMALVLKVDKFQQLNSEKSETLNAM